MASKSDMKSFYKQTKKNAGVTKPTNSKSVTPKLVADLKSPAIIFHESLHMQADDYDEKEELLRQFDTNVAYGPCLGLSRLDRWERATNLGLNPPTDVEPILRSNKVRNECLWDGRV